ncbi:MAG TPA: hypothetical protein VGR16_08265 [Thermomicrobiales bacterium]|nr:hypothetical protein [Thermomicrobiales bacterium]
MRYAFIDYAAHAAGRFAPRDVDEATIRDVVQEPSVRYRSRQFPDRLIAERELPSGPALRIV